MSNISIEGVAAAEHQAATAVGHALGTMGWDGSDPWEHFETALAPAKPHQACDPAAAALRAVVKVRSAVAGSGRRGRSRHRQRF